MDSKQLQELAKLVSELYARQIALADLIQDKLKVSKPEMDEALKKARIEVSRIPLFGHATSAQTPNLQGLEGILTTRPLGSVKKS